MNTWCSTERKLRQGLCSRYREDDDTLDTNFMMKAMKCKLPKMPSLDKRRSCYA